MNKGIQPCFWRAPTDNDKGGEAESYLSKWKAAKLNNLTFVTESCTVLDTSDNLVKIAITYLGIPNDADKISPQSQTRLFKVNLVYSIYGSGDVILECHVEPNSDLPPLPRVGVEFHLDKSMDQIQWYGRGPFECYPDRKAAAHVGMYEQDVGSMHVPYIVPYECSGRADVRWVTFRNKNGYGIYASTYGGAPPMQMNASYYGTAELERATRHEELVKGEDIEVHLNLFLYTYPHLNTARFFLVNSTSPNNHTRNISAKLSTVQACLNCYRVQNMCLDWLILNEL